MKFIVINSKYGETLMGPTDLETINNGSQAYPAYKAMELKVGGILASAYNDNRSIQRVE